MKTLLKITSEDKQRMIVHHKAGVDSNTMRSRFPSLRKYTRQQIAAVKAHCTMGKYTRIFPF
ncbi:MAG TPA: hypothetical protein P5136_01510 [Methanofastidiosum sp.]|nr:hypothetical protein [Methanofastidiosum sp.]